MESFKYESNLDKVLKDHKIDMDDALKLELVPELQMLELVEIRLLNKVYAAILQKELNRNFGYEKKEEEKLNG